MDFYKLIKKNVLRSGRVYGSYFLSATFSVIVFFIFAMLNFHPQLKVGLGGSSQNVTELATMALSVSQVLIIFLSFIFLWYSFGIFAKARKRDLSIYVILGIRPRQLRKLLLGENLMIGITAIFSGITIGTFFMKVILIVIQKALKITSGLDFYFPLYAMLLTTGVYLLLFLLVSFFIIFKIETGDLTLLDKEEVNNELPKANYLLAVCSIVFIFLGYRLLVIFVQSNNAGLWYLFGIVGLTVLGTFLFYHQGMVCYYNWKRKINSFWYKEQMLLTAEGGYRAKQNANLFSLITCTAAVALVAISVTSTLGSTRTNNRNELPAAFILSRVALENQPIDEKEAFYAIGEQLENEIEAAGIQPQIKNVETYEIILREQGVSHSIYGGLMRLSDYNQVADLLGWEQLEATNHELLSFATNIKEKDRKIPNRTVKLYLEADGVEENHELFTTELRRIPLVFTMGYNRIWVATDPFVDNYLEALKGKRKTLVRYQVITYPNWAKEDALNERLLTKLNTLETTYRQEMAFLYDREMTDSESNRLWKKLYSNYYVEYRSAYASKKAKRQANGLILLTGTLIGGVFFLFVASILYFRLFGDLEQQGRYHRNLYRIGLTPKSRHKIVNQQLTEMYFFPILFAIVHSSVAFWGIVQLVGIDLWSNYGWIVISYLSLQLLLFSLSRWRYLLHLDLRAENPNDY